MIKITQNCLRGIKNDRKMFNIKAFDHSKCCDTIRKKYEKNIRNYLPAVTSSMKW